MNQLAPQSAFMIPSSMPRFLLSVPIILQIDTVEGADVWLVPSPGSNTVCVLCGTSGTAGLNLISFLC
jgi:hypothetical protein